MYSVEYISKIKFILSIIIYALYGLSVLSLGFLVLMNVCSSSQHDHHQIGNINHQPLFRVRSGNNDILIFFVAVMPWSLGSSGLRHFRQWLTSQLTGLFQGLKMKMLTLQWRHNGHDGVSNHQPHHCLLNRLFRRRSTRHQSSASLAFVRGIHRWPVNSPHTWPVARKMFPFYIIMNLVLISLKIFPHVMFVWCLMRTQ